MKEILATSESKMGKSVDRLAREYATIRAGRANPAVLDKVTVDYYGTPTPINQIAAVSVSEARILVISPWEPTMIKEIERAIQQSDIGINPTNDGKVVRIVFPQLTEERRKDLVKEIHQMKEEAKVAVRNIRREAMDKFKNLKKDKDNSLSEDDIKEGEKKLQRFVDDHCKQIDQVAAKKETEVMEI